MSFKTILSSRSEIPILVDDENFDFLSKYKWYISQGYARNDAIARNTFMHRLIANTPKGKVTDHINGNKLDNRKSNLRVVTQVENMHNRLKPNKNNLSGYNGITKWKSRWSKRKKNYRAHIRINKRQITLGYFNTIDEALEYRNNFLKQRGLLCHTK